MSNSGAILGIDYGTRNSGFAIGNAITKTARALTSLPMKDGVPNWEQLDKLIAEWEPKYLVVGMPLDVDGEEQPIAKMTQAFIDKLQQRYSELTIETVPEQYTTKSAREALFAEGGYKALQKSAVDSMSAQLILESWFNQNN